MSPRVRRQSTVTTLWIDDGWQVTAINGVTFFVNKITVDQTEQGVKVVAFGRSAVGVDHYARYNVRGYPKYPAPPPWIAEIIA